MQLEAAVEIQKAYSKLTSGQVPFTKKNMCAILVPLRDKYGLTDRQVLAVARNELSLEEIMLLSQTQEETKRHGSGEGLREYLKAIKTIEDNCVPVVRCKACKYYKPDEYECGCDFAGGLPYVKENDFCSYGKRKDGADNAAD